ncbi:PP2C family protein-serine/threonine phosphatase [Nocardioides sp.]|uniref:PP2C family protein-serine/threonine phosphatase n=1 Tax=Nocardioides sp. TaxID=35761 RepID=UPI0039E399E2
MTVQRVEPWSPTAGSSGIWLEAGACSHPGRTRTVNQDSWLLRPPVFLVADGMGGHQAGEVASAIVASSFAELADSPSVDAEAVQRCIALCGERIAAIAPAEGPVPGSTMVALVYVVRDDVAYWLLANIGDSRAYQFRQGRLDQLSHDHSLVQEMIDAGELAAAAAATHPDRHVITRALGAIAEAPADYSLIPVEGASRVLLCSDGVTSELADDLIASALATDLDAAAAAAALIRQAVDAGGRDNATAVVIDVRGGVVQEQTAGRGLAASEDTIPGRGSRG